MTKTDCSICNYVPPMEMKFESFDRKTEDVGQLTLSVEDWEPNNNPFDVGFIEMGPSKYVYTCDVCLTREDRIKLIKILTESLG